MSNAVNERIPVTEGEMEAHWGVDCASAWGQVSELRAKTGERECALPPGLLREIRLCAFIYQPPGEPLMHTGPDFRSASAGSAAAGDCVPSAGVKK